MFKYRNSEIKAMALQSKTKPNILEKTLRLTSILDYFSYANPFYHNLVLKGGPAINLTMFELNRLFIGIEFDFCAETCSKEVLFAALVDYLSSEGYYLTKDYVDDGCTCFFVFTYLTTEGTADSIRIDINYLNQKHLLTPVASFKPNNITENGLIYSLDPKELVGSMLANLVNELDELAVYDLSKIIQVNLFSQEDFETISQCFIYYYALYAKNPNIEEAINDFKGKLLELRSFDYDELEELLRNDEIFDVSVFSARIVNYVNQFLFLNNNEITYILNFSKGKYSPELLFVNEKMKKNVENNPIVDKIIKGE